MREFKLARSNNRHAPPTNLGFTLIELLIVIALLGILAAIAIPSVLNWVDEAKINLLAEQIRQSLKEAQWLAISEGQNYGIRFRTTPQGLQVSYFPVTSQRDSPDDSELTTWHNLSSSIPPDKLVFTIPESWNNTITFLSEGEVEYSSMVFIAMGTLEQPRVNTRRCINVQNSDSGGSYFQVDKDLACNLSPNIFPSKVDDGKP